MPQETTGAAAQPTPNRSRTWRFWRAVGLGLFWTFAWPWRLLRRIPDKALSRRRRVLYAGAGLSGVGLMATVLGVLLLWPLTPGIRNLRQMKVQRAGVLMTANGEVLTRFQHLNREWVSLKDVSPHVVDALIATEDHRFRAHHGVDVRRLLSSTAYTLIGDRQGASTITMQLARNLYPERIGRSSSLTRKVKEIITAFKIESVYDKDEILETYLNTVPFLYNAYGIEMAARTYFRKPAAELDELEAATLVGMLKATSYYNPVRNPEHARQRRNVVLGQMVKRGVLSTDRAASLRDRPVQTRFERQQRAASVAPHFTAHVRAWLEGWADREGYNLYTDGLRIYTTLDLKLQQLAEEAVQRQGQALQDVADVEWGRASTRLASESPHDYAALKKNTRAFSHYWSTQTEAVDGFIRATPRYRAAVAAGNAADETLGALRGNRAFMDSLRSAKTRLEVGFVAIAPGTGQVKAWVGSRNYGQGQYDHVAQARRQPGSTFKPFVYAAALEKGYTPDDTLPDREVEIRISRDQVWRPVNAGGSTGEDITLRDALARSKNTITAQLIDDVGARATARIARAMGVNQSKLEAVPSLGLGTSEVTLLEMTSAYATIAAGGVYRRPVLVTRIEDAEGNVLASFETEEERALSEKSAQALLDMMRGVVDYGTGQRIRTVFGVRADVAGKTGTTQENADGWFLLMHPQLVAGAWVGFNDPRVTFRSDYWGQGAHNALYVVGDFFRHSLRQGRLDPRPKLAPVPVFEKKVPFFTRVGSWFSDTFNGVGERFRRSRAPEPAPRQEAPRQQETQPEPRRWTQRSPDRSPRRRTAEAERENNLTGDLGNLARKVEDFLENQDHDTARRYRSQVENFLREAERTLQERSRSSRIRVQTGDLRVDRVVDEVLNELTRDLDGDQREALEQGLRELRRQLQR